MRKSVARREYQVVCRQHLSNSIRFQDQRKEKKRELKILKSQLLNRSKSWLSIYENRFRGGSTVKNLKTGKSLLGFLNAKITKSDTIEPKIQLAEEDVLLIHSFLKTSKEVRFNNRLMKKQKEKKTKLLNSNDEEIFLPKIENSRKTKHCQICNAFHIIQETQEGKKKKGKIGNLCEDINDAIWFMFQVPEKGKTALVEILKNIPTTKEFLDRRIKVLKNLSICYKRIAKRKSNKEKIALFKEAVKYISQMIEEKTNMKYPLDYEMIVLNMRSSIYHELILAVPTKEKHQYKKLMREDLVKVKQNNKKMVNKKLQSKVSKDVEKFHNCFKYFASNKQEKSFYSIHSVGMCADLHTIEFSFLEKALLLYPKKDRDSIQQFKELAYAYFILSEKETRLKYNQEIMKKDKKNEKIEKKNIFEISAMKKNFELYYFFNILHKLLAQ